MAMGDSNGDSRTLNREGINDLDCVWRDDEIREDVGGEGRSSGEFSGQGLGPQVVVTSAAAKVHYSISRVPESICVIIGVLCAVMLRIYFPQIHFRAEKWRLCGVEEANQTWYRTKNVSFSVGIQMLDDEISSQTYGKGISRLRSDQCFMYYRRIISPLCMSRKLFSPPLCCSAVREAIDEGRCLCEPRAFQGRIASDLAPVIHLARLCRPTFRIPWDLHAIAQLPECQEQISKSTLGHLNAEFLGMSEADLQRLPAKDLPSFDDMFDGPNPGPYVPGKAILQKSPLIHCNSSIWSLGVDVYYPAARDGQGSQLGFAGDGPYPLVAFSPGLGSYPGQHKHMLENLASQGYIVVSQRSTYSLGIELSRKKMLMWKDDIANMVKMVVEMNRDREHFLYQNVDETNIGMSGHSLGGALSIAAAVTLKEVYGIHVKGIVPYSPACIELGQQCEVVAEYAARLHNTRLMLIVGSMDITVPPNTSNFIISQLPRSSSADIHIVQGATHCLWGSDPNTWKFTHWECGKGATAPMKALKITMLQVEKFLHKTLKAGS